MLPSMSSSQAVTMGMDELLFPLCKEQDILFTRQPMDEQLRSYLSQLGYTFTHVHCRNPVHADDYRMHVFDLLMADASYYQQLLPQEALISPYSILSDTSELVRRFNVGNQFPSLDTVRAVNSKIYSHELRQRLGIRNMSSIADSSEELLALGSELLRTGQVLVKDPLGVSGRGNMLISGDRMLKRIAAYLQEQENRGKQTQFIIEPLLDKTEDFSCQLFITEQGEVELFSVQRMVNEAFSYVGSYPAGSGFTRSLRDNDYYSIMEEACKDLFMAGYHGEVCIDSMLLASGELVPIVEINARKSMGLINHHLNNYLQQYSLSSFLTFISAGCSTEVTMLHIIEALGANKLLFTQENRHGIIPLGANTLFGSGNTAFAEAESEWRKGKLYVAASYASDVSEALTLVQRVKDVLKSLAIKIYN
ncbi:hypothetical protein C173_12737 [Paenibacillus sp. FSL R7-277]|nr:hypothetical protein C173_12737 [Paenibacillus sp. FSL R7-277]